MGLRVAMLAANDLRFDSRVRREAASLAAAGHRVTVYAVLSEATVGRANEVTEGFTIKRLPMLSRPVGMSASGSSGPARQRRRMSLMSVVVRLHGATRPLLGGLVHFLMNWQFRWHRWGRRVVAVAAPADVWHAHDLNALPAALACARHHGGRVVYDSHEIFSEAGAAAGLPAVARRILRHNERRWAQRCDAVITINRSLATYLETALDVPRVEVLHNCAEPLERQPDQRLRQATGVPRDAQLVLYHGSLVAHRGLPVLLRAMGDPRLAGAHLVYMGFGPLRPQLEAQAADAEWRDRVHFLAPVPPGVLTAWVVGADVAAMPIEHSTLNHYLSSPNKLFEAMAAGVPVVGPDYPEFRRLVRDHAAGPLGRLCDPSEPSDVAAAIALILRASPVERARLRRRCRLAAVELWNWQREADLLLGLYASLAVAPKGRTMKQRGLAV
jgi:glycosyltransferase involved in cell wall biosynthesis